MRPMRPLTGSLLALALILPAASAEDGFVDLFDGKTLDGWVKRGGAATYAVEDGVIVGTTVPKTPNTFLCTEKHYADFILEYEFKVDDALNSGVQIRSNAYDEAKTIDPGNGKTKTLPAGRVHGYQVEIDPNKPDRLWVGGIYDEARRGWLYPGPKGGDAKAFTAQGQKIYKPGQWNKIRVEAIGSRLRTWLNGEPRADFKDDLTRSGFIGLQVHGVGGRQDPLKARWRHIRIKVVEPARPDASEWKPLFDGTTLAGWQTLPGGTWSVEDGAIVGKAPKTEKRHGMLLSKARYGDFVVRLKYKAIAGNSGFYFRVDRVPGNVSVHGFQAEIDPNRDAGGLYETGGRAWVVKPKPEDVKTWYKPGAWNTMTIRAVGRDVTVQVNGKVTAELKNDPGRIEGHFGLQLHGGQDMHVMFKDIEIRELQK